MLRKSMFSVLILCAVLVFIAGMQPDVSHAAPARPNESVSTRNPADARLGPEFQISISGIDNYFPAIAYDYRRDEYLVAFQEKWTTTRNTGIRRVSASGQLSGESSLYTGGQRAQPAVAYDYTDDEYLIVWMKDPTGVGDGNSPWEIWGDICAYNAANNFTCHGEFRIFQWANRGFWTPRVVWNSYHDQFFVIWVAFDLTAKVTTDIAGVHVSPAGVPDPAAHLIAVGNYPQEANVVYNVAADGNLIVYRRMSSTGGDIYGRFLKWDGSPNGGEFPINYQSVDKQAPAVATNSQGTYLVVWQHALNPSQWVISGQYLDFLGAGTVGPFPIAISAFDAKVPNVVAAGNGSNEYVTVWEQKTATGTAIRARRDRFVETTTIPVDQFEVAPGNFWDNNNPVVAASRSGYLFAYEGDSAGDPTVKRQVYGRLWWPEVVYVPFVAR